MPYRVTEGAFGAGFTARIADTLAEPPVARGATLEEEDYSTRERDPRRIHCAAPGFPFAAGRILAPLRAATAEESVERETKNPRHTAYGPGAFQLWQIGAYRGSYHNYGLPLGEGPARCSTG